MKRHLFWIFFVICVVCFSYGDLIDTIVTYIPHENDNDGDIFYYNSFENKTDTIGWRYIGEMSFRNGGAPGCGGQCIYIAGGYFGPHAYKIFDTLKENGYFKIQFWGKKLALGGLVYLAEVNKNFDSSAILLSDTVWTFYESKNVSHIPAGVKFGLYVESGDKARSELLIDKLQIIKVF
jgi:hypothetical protein